MKKNRLPCSADTVVAEEVRVRYWGRTPAPPELLDLIISALTLESAQSDIFA